MSRQRCCRELLQPVEEGANQTRIYPTRAAVLLEVSDYARRFTIRFVDIASLMVSPRWSLSVATRKPAPECIRRGGRSRDLTDPIRSSGVTINKVNAAQPWIRVYMQIEFVDREEMYSVQVSDGELILCVLMGEVGVWEEKVPMDEAMTRQFRENPYGLLPWVKRVRAGTKI